MPAGSLGNAVPVGGCGVAIVVDAVTQFGVAGSRIGAEYRQSVAFNHTLFAEVRVATVARNAKERLVSTVGRGWVAIVVDAVAQLQVVAAGV